MIENNAMLTTELDQLEELNQQLEKAAPQEILLWAWETFTQDGATMAPAIAAMSSFQTQSVPLLYMIAHTLPHLPVYFIDTGFHFPETLAFRDRLAEEWHLNVKILKPALDKAAFQKQHGDLYLHDPEKCCQINKIQPWQTVKDGLAAWITGIRRDQTATRRHTPVIHREPGGQYKICPLANWTEDMIQQYRQEHSLPAHPLYSQGYRSLGCRMCTSPVQETDPVRAGRWANLELEECGLHLSPQTSH